MDPGDIPLLSMLKGRLGYLANRQRLIAENVANSDTPAYSPRDLKPFTFQDKMQTASQATGVSGIQGIQGIQSPGINAPSPGLAPAGAMAMTQPGHMQVPNGKSSQGTVQGSPDSEMTIDRNGVVLEDQMIKLTDTRMQYDAAISFYQQSMNMLKTAIRKPGG